MVAVTPVRLGEPSGRFLRMGETASGRMGEKGFQARSADKNLSRHWTDEAQEFASNHH
jgi:hypothetical protein